MSEPEASRPGRIGCAAVLILVVGLAVGGGVWLGKREDASKTPCQLYARTMVGALDNCHSGQTREHAHHIAVCEQNLDPSDACLARIKEVAVQSCPDLEQWPHVASADVCRKQP